MQQFDRRHLAASLGDLDAVADQDVPAVDAQCLGQQAKHQRGPQLGELVELDGGGVEIVAERIVAARIEVQRAHDGGDTELLGAHREAGHGGGEPQDFLPLVKGKIGGAVTPPEVSCARFVA